jgi:hypothetical protein
MEQGKTEESKKTSLTRVRFNFVESTPEGGERKQEGGVVTSRFEMG